MRGPIGEFYEGSIATDADADAGAPLFEAEVVVGGFVAVAGEEGIEGPAAGEGLEDNDGVAADGGEGVEEILVFRFGDGRPRQLEDAARRDVEGIEDEEVMIEDVGFEGLGAGIFEGMGDGEAGLRRIEEDRLYVDV